MHFVWKCPGGRGLVRKKPSLSDDGKLPDLISEELSDSSAYYLKIKSSGGDIFGGILQFIDILEEERQGECLALIFATCLTPGGIVFTIRASGTSSKLSRSRKVPRL